MRFLLPTFLCFALCPAFAQTPATPGLRAELAACEIKAGQFEGGYAGGFKKNRDAAGMNFYFACYGLLPVADETAWSERVGTFLDLYLSKTNATYCWIDDVADFTHEPATTQLSDSDDSYVALPLAVIGEFYKTPAGKAWWVSNEAGKDTTKGQRIKKIARRILLQNQKPNGLVTVYSKERKFRDKSEYSDPSLDVPGPDGVTPRERKILLKTNALLMDSCEVYGGLNALVQVLKAERDKGTERPEVVAEFRTARDNVARGIQNLYFQPAHAFYILDGDKKAHLPFYANEADFYPYHIAQTFPQLWSVPMTDAQTTQAYYNGAWSYFSIKPAEDWPHGVNPDGSLDGFPWMKLGYVASLRGAITRATTQLNWYKGVFPPMPAPVTPQNQTIVAIQEIGDAIRLQGALAGTP